jgi:hypothetical protein
VRNGILAATVVVPTNTDLALEVLARSMQSGAQPPERKLTVPKSFPTLEALAGHRFEFGASAGH